MISRRFDLFRTSNRLALTVGVSALALTVALGVPVWADQNIGNNAGNDQMSEVNPVSDNGDVTIDAGDTFTVDVSGSIEVDANNNANPGNDEFEIDGALVVDSGQVLTVTDGGSEVTIDVFGTGSVLNNGTITSDDSVVLNVGTDGNGAAVFNNNGIVNTSNAGGVALTIGNGDIFNNGSGATAGTFGAAGTADSVTVESGGTLNNLGTGSVINAGVTNSGIVNSSQSITGTLTTEAGGDSNLTGGTVGALVSNGGTTDLTGGAQVSGNTDVTGGTVTVGDGATAGTLGDAASDTVDVSGGGTVAVTSTGVITATTTVNAGGTLTNAGTVGDVTLLNDEGAGTAPIFTQSGGSAGNVVNGEGATDLNGDTDTNDTGGTITVTGGTLASLTNNSGTTTLNGAGATVTGNTSVAGGTVTVTNGALGDGTGTDTVSISGGTVDIQTNGSIVGDTTLTGTGTLTNTDGDVDGVTLSNAGTTYTQSGATAVATDVTNDGGTATLSGGSVTDLTTSGGTTTIDGASITNQADINGGQVTVSGTGSLGAGADVSSGELELGGTGTITGTVALSGDGNFDQDAGTVSTVTMADDSTLDQDGGSITNLTVNVTGDGTEDVNLNGAGATNLTLTDGDVTLAGTANVSGTLALNGGTFTNASSALDTAGTQITVNAAATFTNTGTVFDNLVGPGTINNSGTAQNVVSQAGGSYSQTGGASSSQIVTIDNGATGAIGGGTVATLNANGTTSITGGTVSILESGGIGTTTIDGGTVTTANANSGGLVFDDGDIGTVTVASTGSFTMTSGGGGEDADISSQLINNGSTNVVLTGDLNDEIAAIDNNGGTTRINGVEVTGNVTIDSGTVDMDAGEIDGTTTVGDGAGGAGTAILDQDGGTVGTVNVLADGTFDQDAGTAGAVSVAVGGSFDQGGTGAAGTVANNGGTVTLGGTSATSLDNNSGTTTVSGATVTGNTDIGGGEVQLDSGALGDASGDTTTVASGALLDANGGTVNGTLTVQDGGSVTADGASFEDVVIAADGADVDTIGAQFTVTADTTADDVDVNGTLDFAGAGPTELTAETLDLATTGEITNSGNGATTIDLNSNFTLAGGTINSGTGSITIESSGVNLLNSGTITGNVAFVGDITTQIDLSFGTVDALQGNLVINDPDDGTGSTLDDPTVTISAAQDLANGGGDFTITNNGGTVSVTAAGSITNGGAIANNSGGTFIAGGAIIAESFTNDGTENADPVADSTFTLGSGVTMTLTGGSATADFTNSGEADATIDGTLVGNVTNTDTDSTMTVTGTGQITGNVLNENGATFSLTGGTVDGTLDNTDTASASLRGTVTGQITNSSSTGVFLASGGALAANGGVVNESGGLAVVVAGQTMTGDLDNESGGETRLFGTIVGDVTNAGDLNAGLDAGPANGSQITGTLTNEAGGTTTIGDNDTLTVTGLTTNDGTLDVNGSMTGAITNNDQINLSGVIDGDIFNDGTIETDDPGSTIVGTVTNASDTAGDTDGDNGLIEVGSGEILVINAGSIINEDSASVNVLSGGQIVGDITNNDGGDLDIDGVVGEVGNLASIANAGSVELDGEIRGTLDNNGANAAVTVGTAGSSVSGAVTNAGGGVFDVDANFGFGSFDNSGGTVEVADGVAMTATGSPFENTAGTLAAPGVTFEGAASFAGGVRNGGVMGFAPGTSGDDTISVSGGLANAGTFSLVDDATGDVLLVTGGLSQGGTYALDIDLSADGSADLIDVNSGTLSGNVTLDFTLVSTSTPEELNDGITVIDFTGASLSGFSPTASGLPTDGPVLYGLVQNGSTFEVNSTANPAIGGIAGGFTLTQSLVGTIVNRPSTPFVSGLALPGDDPCGYGTWGRFVGGEADADGSVSTGSFGSFDGSISVEFYGAQAGFDYSCFDGTFGGFDLSFGGTLGVNTGSTTQPVFEIVSAPGGGLESGPLNSTNFTDFEQTYVGVYVVGARDNLTFDLQYRVETAEFDFRNELAAGVPADQDLGILDQTVETNGQTLSGSVAYSFPLNEDLGITIVPTAGFAIGRTEIENFELDVDLDDTPDGRIEFDDAMTQIGFAGATVARTQIVGDTSAINYFGTLTYYKDFSSGVTSTVFVDDTDTTGTESTAEPLGDFGELSLGLSYIRIYTQNELGPTRQLTASVRVDGRFSDTLDSYGVTGQVRFQF